MRHLRLLTIAVFVLLGVQPVSAHGYIVRAIPEDRAVLQHAPARLQYWFSEPLEVNFSEVRVRDQRGEVIATGGVEANTNTLMSVRLPSDLPDGAYIVELRPAFASDGHVVAESRVFFVGEEIGGVAGRAADDRAVSLEVVWRVVLLTSSLLLFGAFTLYALVLIPAWASRSYSAGLLPPRVMKRLNMIVGLALLAAFLGNGLALIQQTMVFFNIGFNQALDPDFWSLVRIGSRFGDIWNVRMVLLGIIGAMYLLSLYLRESQPETVRPFWIANAWAAALVLGSFSVLSHAAGSLMLPWVGIAVDWIHIASAGIWAGGLTTLVLVLPVALKPYEDDNRRLALLAALRRFSQLAALVLFLVVASGIYSATNWFYSPDDLTTTFGGALLIKVVLVALLVGIGAMHHITLHPQRYARFEAITTRIRNFLPSLRLEAVVVLAVLFAVAYLSATPVPVPEFAQQEIEAPTAAQQVNGLTVVLTMLPGGPGVNTFDTTITRDGERVEGLAVRLNNVQPSRDVRGDWHTVEPVEAGLYVAAGDEIDESGQWWTLVDIIDEENVRNRLAYEWDISAEASVVVSIPPHAGQVAALMAVLIGVGIAMYPLLRRGYHMLNLDAASVSMALGVTVVTTAALIGGYVVINNTRQSYSETINPPPQVVNMVLPTQASLDRGQSLFDEYCAEWLSQPRDFAALQVRLPRTRDEELYFAVTEGWRNLPACTGDLDLHQRWDIVNYLRTLQKVEL